LAEQPSPVAGRDDNRDAWRCSQAYVCTHAKAYELPSPRASRVAPKDH
jgi:hypothetical protein